MKPVFTATQIAVAFFLVVLNLSSCVQPYSDKAFYKQNNATGDAPSNANESSQSLTPGDIRTMLNTPGLNEWQLARLLQKMNRNWRIKGFDRKTGEVFYVNFYSKDNQEAFVWHSKENTAEYITNNTNHYKSIIANLKTTGYKPVNNTGQDGENYSNGKANVVISQAQLYNNSNGYKVTFTDRN